ncbi:hypothetical protein [Streptomyces sp. NPDC127072]
MVIWDDLNTHVSATVFQLPPYTLELNPVETVWSHLKRSLANLADEISTS